MKSIYLSCLLLLTVICCACARGGGGIDTPAASKIKASPNNIDSGDTSTVRAEVRGFEQPRLLVKFRFPKALSYIAHSSLVAAGEDYADESGPSDRLTDDTDTYLLYPIDTEAMGISAEDPVFISFRLIGVTSDPESKVELDVDTNISREDINFDIDNPKFDAQSDATLIVGPAPSPTPVDEAP